MSATRDGKRLFAESFRADIYQAAAHHRQLLRGRDPAALTTRQLMDYADENQHLIRLTVA